MHAAEQRWLDVAEQCQTAAQGAETRRVEAMEEGDRAAAIVRWARWASAIEGDAVSAAATAAAAAAAAAVVGDTSCLSGALPLSPSWRSVTRRYV